MRIFLLSEYHEGQNDSDAVLLSTAAFATLEAAQANAQECADDMLDESDEPQPLDWQPSEYSGFVGWVARTDDGATYLVRESQLFGA